MAPKKGGSPLLKIVLQELARAAMIGGAVAGVVFTYNVFQKTKGISSKTIEDLPEHLRTSNIESDPKLCEQLSYAAKYEKVAPKLMADLVKSFDSLIAMYNTAVDFHKRGKPLPPTIMRNAHTTAEIIKRIAGQFADKVKLWQPADISDVKVHDLETFEMCMDVIYEIAAIYTFNIEMTYGDLAYRGTREPAANNVSGR